MWSPQKAEHRPSPQNHITQYISQALALGAGVLGLVRAPFLLLLPSPEGTLGPGPYAHASARVPTPSTHGPAWHLTLLTAKQGSSQLASPVANAAPSTGQLSGLTLEASSCHSPKSNLPLGPVDATSKTHQMPLLSTLPPGQSRAAPQRSSGSVRGHAGFAQQGGTAGRCDDRAAQHPNTGQDGFHHEGSSGPKRQRG